VADPAPDAICHVCGHPAQDHFAVNYADGPHVTGVTLVCPTSVFQPKFLPQGPIPDEE
jgi:hypothetical protein